MNTLSLFQDESLSKELLEVINNKKPKSDLEKTQWWNFLICESLANNSIREFIKNDWPHVKPTEILHNLLAWHRLTPETPEDFKIHPILQEFLIDKKLIGIIEKERKILSSCKLDSDIEKLLSESQYWIETINKGRIEVTCDTADSFSSWDEYDKINMELANLVLGHFPKTLDYCKKQKLDVGICGVIDQIKGFPNIIGSNLEEMINDYKKKGKCDKTAPITSFDKTIDS